MRYPLPAHLSPFALITVSVMTLALVGCGAVGPGSAIDFPKGTRAAPVPTSTIATAATANAPTPQGAVRLPDDLEIVTDISDPNPERLPKLAFDAINSEFFIKKLIDMDARGLLREVPDAAITLTKDNSVEYMGNYSGSGHEVLFDPPGDIPTQPHNRPYIIVGYWLTNQPGYPELPAILQVYKWKNSDNTQGFFAFLRNTGPKKDAEEAIVDARRASYRNDIIPTGTIFGKDSTGDYCTQWSDEILGSSSYCSWYYANTEITLAPIVFENWEETGILSNLVSEDGGDRYILPITEPGYSIR